MLERLPPGPQRRYPNLTAYLRFLRTFCAINTHEPCLGKRRIQSRKSEYLFDVCCCDCSRRCQNNAEQNTRMFLSTQVCGQLARLAVPATRHFQRFNYYLLQWIRGISIRKYSSMICQSGSHISPRIDPSSSPLLRGRQTSIVTI